MIVPQPFVSARVAPFPHVISGQALSASLADAALKWFESAAPWQMRIESFYEQYEMNLHQVDLPAELGPLVDDEAIKALAVQLLSPLTDDQLTLVEANAHKLLAGQTIRIHNDFISGDETHRILIHVNRGWTDQNGGMLMLFSGPVADDVVRLIRSIHRSVMGFEISPASFHAVSTIHTGERYTLVYSFRRAG